MRSYFVETRCTNRLQGKGLSEDYHLARDAQIFGLYKAGKIRQNAARSLACLAHRLLISAVIK